MEDQIDILLVRTLGIVDAVWRPVRQFGHCQHANAYHARQAYEGSGVPYAARGKGMKGVRTLDAAVDAGMVVASSRAGRTVCVKLTAAGEARARSLALMPKLTESCRLVQAILDAGGAARWLAEDSLSGLVPEDFRCDDQADTLVALMDLAAPALAREWIEAGSTTRANVCYRAGKKVEAFLAGDLEAMTADEADLPGGDDHHRRIYLASVQSHLETLREREPADRGQEIGIMPLAPCVVN